MSRSTDGYLNSFGDLAVFILCAACIFSFPSIVSQGATNGLRLSAAIIIPSVFPFTVLSVFLIKSGAALKIGGLLDKAAKIMLGLNGAELSVIVLSLMGGYPVGARLAEELYLKGATSKQRAEALLYTAINPGPSFIISVVGISLLRSFKAGIILFISNLLAEIFLIIVCHRLPPKRKYFAKGTSIPKSASSNALVESVSAGAQITINVCAWIVLFSALGAAAESIIKSERIYHLIMPFFEITVGINSINQIHPPLYLYSFFLAFGGLSALCQIKSAGGCLSPRLGKLIFYRLLHAYMAAVISALLFKLFPVAVPTLSGAASSPTLAPPMVLPALMLIIFSLAFLTFLKPGGVDIKIGR